MNRLHKNDSNCYEGMCNILGNNTLFCSKNEGPYLCLVCILQLHVYINSMVLIFIYVFVKTWSRFVDVFLFAPQFYRQKIKKKVQNLGQAG